MIYACEKSCFFVDLLLQLGYGNVFGRDTETVLTKPKLFKIIVVSGREVKWSTNTFDELQAQKLKTVATKYGIVRLDVSRL